MREQDGHDDSANSQHVSPTYAAARIQTHLQIPILTSTHTHTYTYTDTVGGSALENGKILNTTIVFANIRGEKHPRFGVRPTNRKKTNPIAAGENGAPYFLRQPYRYVSCFSEEKILKTITQKTRGKLGSVFPFTNRHTQQQQR